MIAALVLAGLALALSPEHGERDDVPSRCTLVLNGVAAAREDRPRLPAFPGAYSAVTVSAVPSFCTGWTVVAIMTFRDVKDSEPRWIARRVALTAGAVAPTTMWLEARTCPAFIRALEALDRVPVSFGLPIGPTPSARPAIPVAPVVDGTDYTVAGDFRQPDGQLARLSLSGNAGPAADWAERTLAAIEPCWSAIAPGPDGPDTR